MIAAWSPIREDIHYEKEQVSLGWPLFEEQLTPPYQSYSAHIYTLKKFAKGVAAWRSSECSAERGPVSASFPGGEKGSFRGGGVGGDSACRIQIQV